MADKLEGVKYDGDKNRLDLIPADALWEVGQVYSMGAKKYDPWNWRKGIAYSRVFAALLRHAYKWWMGEQFDQEDGQRHLASVVWCALTLMHYDLAPKTFGAMDDRQKGWSEVWKNATTK